MLGIKKGYLKGCMILCQNKAIWSGGNHSNGIRLYAIAAGLDKAPTGDVLFFVYKGQARSSHRQMNQAKPRRIETWCLWRVLLSFPLRLQNTEQSARFRRDVL